MTTTATEIRVSSGSPLSVHEKAPETKRSTARGELVLRVERPDSGGAETWRVQLGAFARRESAETLARKLEESLSLEAVIRTHPDSGVHQVRIGSFPSREAAGDWAAATLAPAGYPGFLIVRETGRSGTGDPVVSLRASGLLSLNRAGFLLFPAGVESPLRLNGKAYRGFLDVQLNPNGRLTVVNEVGLEDYLLSVVPAEISPTTYPESAVLAAQAIAARTYALKNKGRFAAEGFDLTADVRSQVYGGQDQEREGTTRAVRQTAGIAIFYQGNPIDALYTSTCGGRTEDSSGVFDSAPVPYLQSVACTTEEGSGGPTGVLLRGRAHPGEILSLEDGTPSYRNLELARILGLDERSAWTAEEGMAPASGSEIRVWLERAAGRLRHRPPQDLPDGTGSVPRAEFLRMAAEALIGTEQMDRSVASSDAEYLLRNLRDGAEIPERSKKAVAYLIRSRLWHPFPDNSVRPAESAVRSHCLSFIAGLLEQQRPELLPGGTLDGGPAGGEKGATAIRVRGTGRVRAIDLTPDVALFRLAGEKSLPVDSLALIGSERLRFHLDARGKIDFLEAELSRTGASSDRFSPQAAWQSTFTRSDLEAKLRPLAGSIGELLDLRPARLGKSGRAVQIELVGSRRTVVVNGYRARGLLGLKDTLFTIQRVYGPNETVEKFVFDGRGWGHGVGLCQVGAYGMARAGRSYEEILKAYYLGTELHRAY